MRIDFKKLTKESGINMSRLAEELVMAGHFKNKTTAYIMLYRWTAGKGKSINLDLLYWIKNRFDIDIINFFKFDN